MVLIRIAKFFAHVTYFTIFVLNPHTLAAFRHSDCNDTTIKNNYHRVCVAYPSLKRSTDPFHNWRLSNQDSRNSPDSVLYNFPQSTSDDNSGGIQSFKLPILTGTSFPAPNSPQNQFPISQPVNGYGNGKAPIHQQPIYAPNFQFAPQHEYPQQNFQYQKPQWIPPFLNPEPSIRNPLSDPLHSVLSWIGSFDTNSLDPISRWRRNQIKISWENFITNECCTEKGCPFPEAWFKLDQKVHICRRR